MGAKPLNILSTLLLARGDLVTKDELMERVWPGMVVEENTLQAHISAIRKALGEDGRWIATVPGRGYRFVGPRPSGRDQTSPQEAVDPADRPTPTTDHRISAERTAPAADPARAPPRQRVSKARFAAAAALAAAVAAAVWLWPEPQTPASPHLERYLVLPFANRTGDPHNDELADSLSDGVATQFAAQAWDAEVLSHATAFALKGQVVDTAQLARKFDLDYIIDGRVFSETDGIEASIDMIDAKSGIRIGSVSSGPPVNGGGVDRQWLIASLADQARYAIYDQQVRQIQASPGDDHDVRSLLVRAQAAMDEQNKDRLVDACALIDKALAIAPDNVHALTVAAQAQIEFVADFLFTDAKDRAARLERAEFLLAKAARLDPKRAQIHLMYGDLRSQQGRHAAALAEYERVLELFPRNVFAIEGSAMENLYLGRMDEVLPTLDRAQRLGPQDMYLIAGDIAITQLTLGQDEEALAAIRKAVTVDSADPWVWAYSAGLLQLTGHREEAQAALATLRRINPTMTVAKLQLADADTSPRYHDAQERLYAALKEAGLAEGDTR